MSASIVVGVTGSIAAYKAAEVVRRLIAHEHDVHVIMTAAATRYVGPLTFFALSGNPVATGGFDDVSPAAFPHIDLGQQADAMLIAPCTANVIAKIAHGIADDVLTATVLARTNPLLIAPAMNDRMWTNPATRDNVDLLRQRGVQVLDVNEGGLACGATGPGRMMEPEDVVAAVSEVLSRAE